jgi:hypothetical protein
VLFRGTDASGKGEGKKRARGIMADVDPVGVGWYAHWKASGVLENWLKTARTYNRITVTGHSLGGAFAQRFYIMANRKGAGGQLRLITFQSAAIDMLTRSRLFFDDPRDKGAKVTHVGAGGDIVQGGGAAYVGGETFKYKSQTKGGKHTQLALAEQQLNKSLNPRLDQVLAGDQEVQTNRFGYHGSWGLSILKGIGSVLAESARMVGGLIAGTAGTLGSIFTGGRKVDMGIIGQGTEDRLGGDLTGQQVNKPLENYVVSNLGAPSIE